MNKLSDRELLELFGAFLDEVEKNQSERNEFDALKQKMKNHLGEFPIRFAEGAEKLLKMVETTQVSP